jgi:hypothetical protein
MYFGKVERCFPFEIFSSNRITTQHKFPSTTLKHIGIFENTGITTGLRLGYIDKVIIITVGEIGYIKIDPVIE